MDFRCTWDKKPVTGRNCLEQDELCLEESGQALPTATRPPGDGHSVSSLDNRLQAAVGISRPKGQYLQTVKCSSSWSQIGPSNSS